jgi:hypothetical protein
MSNFIISIEILFSLLAINNFINRNYSNFSMIIIFTILLSLMTQFIFGDFERNIGIKILVFFICITAASLYPKIACFLLLGTILIQAIYTYYENAYGTKYGVFPFGFFVLVFIILLFQYDRFKSFNQNFGLKIVNFFYFLQLYYSYFYGLRSGIIIASISLIILNNNYFSKLFFNNFKYFPFIYYLVSLFVYNFMLDYYDNNWIDLSDSNIERSSMNIAVINNITNYLFYGPKSEFDTIVADYMFQFGKSPYSFEGGIDPHSFLFSAWRDLGSIVLVLLSAIWLLFWKGLYARFKHADSKISRIITALLVVGVIQFCVFPPAAIYQFQVALIFGIGLYFSSNLDMASSQK